MPDVSFAFIDEISQIVSRKEVRSALEEMLAAAELQRISQAIEKMRTKPAYVAAIGSQGTGKSSLLNSLLFSRRVLPIGESVTTNVVCYIQEANAGEDRCEVSLGNKVERLPLDRATLELFMDEAQNPKNYKGVTRITCFTQSNLLSNRTHFVDTPGLGAALNEFQNGWHANPKLNSHDRTTLDFVPDLSLGIFVHRTTPTLLESEIAFLKMIWQTSPEFIFVQNIWGESPQQVQESLRVNRETLTQLAQDIGDRRPIYLVPVNIHEGLEGVANAMPDKVETSGLAHLVGLIKGRISRGGQRLEITIQGQQIISCFRLAIQEGETQLAAASVRDEPAIEKLKEQIEEAENLRRRIDSAHPRRVEGFHTACDEDFDAWRRDLLDQLESTYKDFEREVRTRGGQSGIEDAYLDKLRRAASRSCEDFKSSFGKRCRDFVQESAMDIGRILESIHVALPQNASLEDVAVTHIVEGAGNLATSVSGVALTALTALSAGAFAESLVAGATLTSALSAGAATVPVVGWVIALGVLAAGYFLKRAAKERRVNILTREFDRVVRTLKEDVVSTMKQYVRKTMILVTDGVDGHMRAAVAQHEKQARNLKATLSATQDQRAAKQAHLRKMLHALTSAAAEIEQLVDVSMTEPLSYKAG